MTVADLPGASHRALLPDARGVKRFLRVSWHPAAGQFVVSTWEDDRCLTAVRLVADTASELVALLSEALAEAADGSGWGVGPAAPAEGGASFAP